MDIFFRKEPPRADSLSIKPGSHGFDATISGRPGSQEIMACVQQQHGQILATLERLDIALSHSSRKERRRVVELIQLLGSMLDRHSLEEDNFVYKRLLASIGPGNGDYRTLQSLERAEKADRQRVFNFFLTYRNVTPEQVDLPRLREEFKSFSRGIISHMEMEEIHLFELLAGHLQ